MGLLVNQFPFEPVANLVPDAAELALNPFFGPLGMIGIIKGPMPSLDRRREQRTLLLRRRTNADDQVRRSPFRGKELVDVLASLRSNVDPEFLHRRNGARMDVTGRFRSGRQGLETLTGQVPQEALGHLAAAGIPRTQEQNSSAWLIHRIPTTTQ